MTSPSPSVSVARATLCERAVAAGPASLSDVELLAVLLTRKARGAPAWGSATRLLRTYGSLCEVARSSPHQLLSEPHLDASRVAWLLAAFELGRRVTVRLLTENRSVIGSFESVATWAHPRLAGLEHEEVWVLMLDGRNGLKSATRVAQGGVHGCALTPKDVLRPPVRDGASAFVLVHNHPSGDPTPSAEDVAMTQAVSTAADLVGVPLLDHVIVARGGATSLTEFGALG